MLLPGKSVPSEVGFQIDFSTAETVEPMTIVNYATADSNGWNLTRPHLQVGHNPTYKNDCETDAVLFLDLTRAKALTLSSSLELDTEQGYDFFEIFATDNNEKIMLYRASGTQPLATLSFDMKQFSGRDNVALRFKFKSDAMEVAAGVRLHTISLK